DAQYSHGYLVPAFALGLLWQRRALLQQASPAPAWWGIPILAMGIGLHLAGAYFYYTWFEALSLLPSLAGLVLMLGGLAPGAALGLAGAGGGVLFFLILVP